MKLDANSRPRPFMTCGCSFERTFADHVVNLRGVKLEMKNEADIGPMVFSRDDTIATIRAQSFAHIGVRFGDPHVDALLDHTGAVVRPAITVNSSWFIKNRGDGSAATPYEGDRPVRTRDWRQHYGHVLIGSVRGLQEIPPRVTSCR